MKQSFERKFLFIFLLITVSVFVFGVISFRNNSSVANSYYWVSHTEQVLYRSEKIISDLKDIETGMRGFGITGDTTFLDTYFQSKDSVMVNIQKLALLTRDNPGQQLRINKLNGLAFSSLKLYNDLSKTTFETGVKSDTFLKIVRSGKLIMDRLRTTSAAIENEENRLLAIREKANNDNYRKLIKTIYFLFGGTCFVFVLGYLIMKKNFYYLKKDAKELSQLNTRVKFLNKQIDEIIDGISDPFYALDSNYRFIYLNIAAQKGMHYDKDLIMNKNIFEVFPAYKENIVGQNIRLVHNSQKAISFEVYDELFECWQDVTVYPTAGGLTVYIKDASERKANEKELLKTKASLEETSEVAIVGGWEIDSIKETVYWSPVTKLIHQVESGFEPDLKNAINFYKAGEHRDTINRLVKNAIENGNEYDAELQILTAKGKERWVRIKGKTEFRNNLCVRLFGTIQDIDEQKMQVYKLKQSEEQFRSAFVYSAVGMALISTDKRMKEINESLCNIVGYSHKELFNLTFEEITHPGDLDTDWQLMQELINGKRQSYQLEKRYYHKDGNIVWVLSVVSTVKDLYGKIVYFIEQIQDITDIKEKEKQLESLNISVKESNRELAIKNEELEQFAHVASHDLQEPIRIISGFLSKIEKKYNDLLDDDGRRYIHFAVDGATRMRQMIADILDYSRLGSNTQVRFMNVNLNLLIKEMIRSGLGDAERLNAVIEVGDLPVIRADITSMEQLFSNLLTNALKYQAPGNKPIIKINAADNSDHWKFSIADNGIGIDPESFHKVFNIFQRLHDKSKYSGSGIGLAICKRIINNMKGEIWIESSPGLGCTFYFTIMKQVTQTNS